MDFLLGRTRTEAAPLDSTGGGAARDTLGHRSWYRRGVVLSILGPLWLCAFGVYDALRNFCMDSCDQPLAHPADHWPAWIGTAVCVGLIWAGTWVLADWRRFKSPLVGADLLLARSSPVILLAAVAGGCYAVLAQDVTAGGRGWAYTGGSVWVWLMPTVAGIVLLGLNFRALRREWKPMDAPAILALVAALVVGVGYVTWQGLRPGQAAPSAAAASVAARDLGAAASTTEKHEA